MAHFNIQLFENQLDASAAEAFVADVEAGGTVVFIGTVRRRTAGREVLRLEFEAYEPMAILQMKKIAAEAAEQFDVLRLAMQHRLGVVEIGSAAVVIAVATRHRAAAFEACRFCIDELKSRVPIFKKEIFLDGEVWVAAHP